MNFVWRAMLLNAISAATGPKTVEGRRAVAEATRNRIHSGQQEKALEGFYRWLKGRAGLPT